MEYLVLQALFGIVGVIIGAILSIIGLFFFHIILFDSIALALLAGFLAKGLLGLHPAFALLIGLGTFLVLFFIQNTRFGFWIVGGLLSSFWAFIFAWFTYDVTGQDMVWTYTVLGLGFVMMIGLHVHARERFE